jgi:hypothetical protein
MMGTHAHDVSPSNLDEMKRRLGPLGWATRSLDGFLKVSHFDDFLARMPSRRATDLFASALEQADIKPSWADSCLAHPAHGRLAGRREPPAWDDGRARRDGVPAPRPPGYLGDRQQMARADAASDPG